MGRDWGPRVARPALPPIGQNQNASELLALCPVKHYNHCFRMDIARRHNVTSPWNLHKLCAGRPPEQTQTPVAAGDERPGAPGLSCALAAPEQRPWAQLSRFRLHLVVGVISFDSSVARMRRDAARATWMTHPRLGVDALACFVLSSQYDHDAMRTVRAEHATHRDMLFVDAAETPSLIRTKTRYSGGRKHGRGMPTFKQFAFWQLAASAFSHADWVAKVDDDASLSLHRLLPFLHAAGCHTHVLLGSIHWSGFVPAATWSGVRGDRCGWGWNLMMALDDYARPVRAAPGRPRCDQLGALLPFPYAAGSGYFLSRAVLRWIGTSDAVGG